MAASEPNKGKQVTNQRKKTKQIFIFQLSNSLQGIPALFGIVMTNAISKHLAVKVRQACFFY